MTLGRYLFGSAVLSLVLLAAVSEGPLDLIILAIFPWAPSALYAVAARKYQTSIARYAGPLVVLLLMAGLMLLGST